MREVQPVETSWQEYQKGLKAFYILRPMFKKIIEDKTLESGEFVRQEKQILIASGIPVLV